MALAAAWSVANAQPAGAATSTASFGVTATVVATCTLSPAPRTSGPVCLQPPRSAIPLPAAPVVRFSRDPQTGALVQTVEF
jgi:hypothetical protein